MNLIVIATSVPVIVRGGLSWRPSSMGSVKDQTPYNWRRPFWGRNVLLSEAIYHVSYARKPRNCLIMWQLKVEPSSLPYWALEGVVLQLPTNTSQTLPNWHSTLSISGPPSASHLVEGTQRLAGSQDNWTSPRDFIWRFIVVMLTRNTN